MGALVVAAGASEARAEVAVRRVPELVPGAVAEQFHDQYDQAAPIATVDELPEHDAIVFGTATRYGNIAAQMKQFIDQTGGL
ncbi:NAD(P)H dehydrogenase (quinone) [Methylobacterium trifolii]|uniref:NAD(P)H dehydrogenase (Quinone) n=1 Tax=Methylobacterium trifolii TaxID=1003092 RepID=A0ABQ4U1H7_9HYPH|nr:NAD(P)H dehydrogenase (quinone) [Methylobacterium trifolii]